MRKSLFLTLCVLLAGMNTLQAQEYDLYQMSEEVFAAGGNTTAGWSFERYEKETGQYAPFTIYGDSGRINQYDGFGPYRFGGELKGEKDPETGGGHQSYGYFPKFTSLYNDKSEFIYVGNGVAKFETQSTKQANPAFVFTVPQDGYYKIEMSVQNQDAPTTRFDPYPMIVNRFRYSDQSDINQANQSSNMGLNVSYSQGGIFVGNGGQLPDGSTADRNWYTPFQPESYYIYFNAKQGDKVTVEPTYGQGTDNDSDFASGASLWNRTRWHALKAIKVTQEEAEADERYVDPHAPVDFTRIDEIHNEAITLSMNSAVGKDKGEYSQAVKDEFQAVINDYEAHTDEINTMNIHIWEQRLLDAIATFKAKANEVAWIDHYQLFPFDENDANELAQHNAWFKEQQTDYANARWKFASYANATGVYAKIANYATAGRYNVTESWHDSTGDYFYIGRDNAIHSLANKQTAIIFTAPQDGYYKVYQTIKRDGAPVAQNYEMFMRNRYISASVNAEEMNVPKEAFVMAKGYGAGATEEIRTAPADTSYYILMKTGDRLTFEQDNYTANRNGNGGSKWLQIAIIDMQKEYASADEIRQVIEEDAERVFIDPFKAGDFTELSAKIAEYEQFLGSVEIGNQLGAFTENAKITFEEVIAEAKDLVTAGTAPQLEIETVFAKMNSAYNDFLTKRNIAICTPDAEDGSKLSSGLYYIKVDGYYMTVPLHGNNNANMLLETKIPNPDNTTLNRQVWNVQYNKVYTEPQRYTLVSDTSEVWASAADGRIHFDELGRVKMGNTAQAQSADGANNTWRNHSVYFDGTSYCIFNVQKQNSIVLKAEVQQDGTVTAVFSTSADKVFCYELVPVTDDQTGIDGESVDGLAVNIFGTNNGIVIENAQAGFTAQVFDISGRLIKNIKLSGGYDTVDVNAGLYIVRVASGNAQKVNKVIVNK